MCVNKKVKRKNKNVEIIENGGGGVQMFDFVFKVKTRKGGATLHPNICNVLFM